jgi:hypothetical protein
MWQPAEVGKRIRRRLKKLLTHANQGWKIFNIKKVALKAMKQILFILCAALIARACDIVEPDGIQGDIIKFSKTKLFFTAQGGTDSITSQGVKWEMEGMEFDKKEYFF